VHWLLGGMKASLPYKYFRSPKWIGGDEAFDGVLLSRACFINRFGLTPDTYG